MFHKCQIRRSCIYTKPQGKAENHKPNESKNSRPSERSLAEQKGDLNIIRITRNNNVVSKCLNAYCHRALTDFLCNR